MSETTATLIRLPALARTLYGGQRTQVDLPQCRLGGRARLHDLWPEEPSRRVRTSRSGDPGSIPTAPPDLEHLTIAVRSAAWQSSATWRRGPSNQSPRGAHPGAR